MVTVSGLIIWILVSFILLLEYKEYLVQRAPWTVMAVLGPVFVLANIITTREIDFYYAGLFTPAWIGVGIVLLAVYDGRKCPGRLDGAGKDQIDVERGIGPRDLRVDETSGAPENQKPQVAKTNHTASGELSRTPTTSEAVAVKGRTTTK